MFGWLAAALFAIAALLIFGTITGINPLGVIALGLVSLAVHLSGVGPRYPWRRTP
jgi:hypothetical protein